MQLFEDTDLKRCRKCKELKSKSDFTKRKSSKDGLEYTCKLCRKEWREDNKDTFRAYDRKYKEANRGKLREYQKNYRKNKKHIVNYLNAKRRAAKLEATPDWLTEDHYNQIKDIYWLVQDLKTITGEEYHVDHIVPLLGEEVRGLHVPWNLQILPADINLNKGNRLEDGSTET